MSRLGLKFKLGDLLKYDGCPISSIKKNSAVNDAGTYTITYEKNGEPKETNLQLSDLLTHMNQEKLGPENRAVKNNMMHSIIQESVEEEIGAFLSELKTNKKVDVDPSYTRKRHNKLCNATSVELVDNPDGNKIYKITRDRGPFKEEPCTENDLIHNLFDTKKFCNCIT